MTGADGISTLPPGNDYGFISCAETSQAYGRDVHPGDPSLAMLNKLRMYCRRNAQRCKDCKGVDGFWSKKNAILSDQCVGESFGALTMGLVTACLRYVSKAILEGAFRRGQAVFRAKELGY